MKARGMSVLGAMGLGLLLASAIQGSDATAGEADDPQGLLPMLPEAIDQRGLHQGDLLNDIYHGQFETLGHYPFPVEYAYKFAEHVHQICPGGVFTDALLDFAADMMVAPLTQGGQEWVFNEMARILREMQRNPGAMGRQIAEKELSLQHGPQDAATFLRRYPCHSDVSGRLFDNVSALLKGQPPRHAAPPPGSEASLPSASGAEWEEEEGVSVERGALFTHIRYDAVEVGFVPPMPEEGRYRIPYIIYLDGHEVDALTRVSVQRFTLRHVHGAPGGVMSRFRSLMKALLSSQPVVLQCQYRGTSSNTVSEVNYWYRELPHSVDPGDLERRAYDGTFFPIREARDECPPRLPG